MVYLLKQILKRAFDKVFKLIAISNFGAFNNIIQKNYRIVFKLINYVLDIAWNW